LQGFERNLAAELQPLPHFAQAAPAIEPGPGALDAGARCAQRGELLLAVRRKILLVRQALQVFVAAQNLRGGRVVNFGERRGPCCDTTSIG